MKRLALVLSMLCGLGAAAPMAHAQTTPPPTATPQPTASAPPTVTPTTVPTQVPVQFSVKARWEKPKQKPKLNGAVLKTSKVGKAVQADLYLVVNSAPESAPVSIHVEVRLAGKKVASADDDENLASSDPTGWYPDPFTYKPKKTGNFTIFSQIEIGGKTVTAKSAVLKVTK